MYDVHVILRPGTAGIIGGGRITVKQGAGEGGEGEGLEILRKKKTEKVAFEEALAELRQHGESVE